MTVKIVVSEQGYGAFTVVDVDTLWRNRRSGRDFHWKGRACKGYTRVGGEWKLILPTPIDRTGSTPELFNIANDPEETKDVSAEHADIVRRLRSRIKQWWGEAGWNSRETPYNKVFP